MLPTRENETTLPQDGRPVAWGLCARFGRPALALAALVSILMMSACSSSATKYTDKTYHFSFTVPSGWKISGSSVTGPEYSVQFSNPYGMRIAVDPASTPIVFCLPGKPTTGCIVNNSVKVGGSCLTANGKTAVCRYLHRELSGNTALQIEFATHAVPATVFADYILANTAKHSYQLELRMPLISEAMDTKLQELAKSFHIASGE